MAGVDKDLISQLRNLLRPLHNRVANMVARGVITLTNDGKKQQELQLGVLADEPVPDAEHFHPYGFSSVPLPGAEVVVVFPNGDRGHPLVVAVSDRRHRPTGGEPGEVTFYNDAGAKVVLKSSGDIVATPAAGKKLLVDDGAGGTEPLVTRSEFLGHTHLTAGTGAPTPPTKTATPGLETDFPGTTLFEAK